LSSRITGGSNGWFGQGANIDGHDIRAQMAFVASLFQVAA
jgi:hypothetical protein